MQAKCKNLRGQEREISAKLTEYVCMSYTSEDKSWPSPLLQSLHLEEAIYLFQTGDDTVTTPCKEYSSQLLVKTIQDASY